MQFAQIIADYPETVALFGSQNAFYRVLHHSCVADRRDHRRGGSGVPVHYTPDHVRMIALRRLLSEALTIDSVRLPRTMNAALVSATFDHDQQTAQIVADGCVISLAIPDSIWHELVPNTQGAHTHA